MGLIYQDQNSYFAQTGNGLEEVLAEELTSFGADEVRVVCRGVSFVGSQETLYRAVYESRMATRVLAPVAVFDCHSDRYLYKRSYEVPWEDFLTPQHTFAVQSVITNSRVRHSGYAALKIKDAIADRFRELKGRRPSVDTRKPDLWVHLRLNHDKAVLSVDAGSGSLHRRGYRRHRVEAPLQENLAAGMLKLSGWDGTRKLVDPMCGSGTILAEAFMMAAKIPSGYLRPTPALCLFPDFDYKLWAAVRERADAQICAVPDGLITGYDQSLEAVDISRANLSVLPDSQPVRVFNRSIQDQAGWNDVLIITNPPYGIRMGSRDDAAALLRSFGDVLKQRCSGSEAWIFFGEPAAVKALGLKPQKRFEVRNGDLDGRFCSFPLFAGPRIPHGPKKSKPSDA